MSESEQWTLGRLPPGENRPVCFGSSARWEPTGLLRSPASSRVRFPPYENIIKKKIARWTIFFFMVRPAGIDRAASQTCILVPFFRGLRTAHCSTAHRAVSPRSRPHGSDSHLQTKKRKRYPKLDISFFWCARRESNPRPFHSE